MTDLDNLKTINDTYGHDWGDQLPAPDGPLPAAGQCPAGHRRWRGSRAMSSCCCSTATTAEGGRAEGASGSCAAGPARSSASTLPGRQQAAHPASRAAWPGIPTMPARTSNTLKRVRRFCDVSRSSTPRKGESPREFNIGMHYQRRHLRHADRAASLSRCLSGIRQVELPLPAHLLGPRTAMWRAYEALMRPRAAHPALAPEGDGAGAARLGRLYDIEQHDPVHAPASAYEALEAARPGGAGCPASSSTASPASA